MCAVRCLGKTIEGSGLDQARLFSEVIVNQIINGGLGDHYNQAVEAHEVTLQVLYDLWFHEFFNENPIFVDDLARSIEVHKSNSGRK